MVIPIEEKRTKKKKKMMMKGDSMERNGKSRKRRHSSEGLGGVSMWLEWSNNTEKR